MEKCEVRSWDDAGVHVVQVSGEFDIAACKRFRAASDRDDAELTVVDLRGPPLGARLISLQRVVAARSAARDPAPGGHSRPPSSRARSPVDDRVPLLAEFNDG